MSKQDRKPNEKTRSKGKRRAGDDIETEVLAHYEDKTFAYLEKRIKELETNLEANFHKGFESGLTEGLKRQLENDFPIYPIPPDLKLEENTRIVVIDTSVLMQYPDIIENMTKNLDYPIIFVIPNVVSDELDENKKWSKEAREASRFLNKIIYEQGGQTKDIYDYEENKIVFSDLSLKSIQKNMPGGHKITNDKIIVIIAAFWKYTFCEKEVFLLSLDNNLLLFAAGRIKSLSLIIRFPEGAIPTVEMPKAFEEISLSDEKLNELNTAGKISSEGRNLVLFPNGLYKDSHSKEMFFADREARNLLLAKNHITAWKNYYQIPKEMVNSRNEEQALALCSLLNPNIPLVFLIGTAGTGKTILALLAAILQLEIKTTGNGLSKKLKEYAGDSRKTYKKLTVTRPHVPMEGAGDIGWLPGDEKHKMAPWLRPIGDNLNNMLPFEFTRNGEKLCFESMDKIKDLLNFEALTYIRGRSFGNEFMILDEAQNLPPATVKTILTRPGEHTKIVLTGDPYQIDNPYLSKTNNGLVVAAEITKHLPQTAIHVLEKVERSELAKMIGALPF